VKESNVDIFEQLENKVAKTIQTLETIQLEKMELQEELDTTQQTVAEQQQKLDELQQKNELLNKETIRLAHEKNEVETRIASLMQTLELAVSDAEQVLGMNAGDHTELAQADAEDSEAIRDTAGTDTDIDAESSTASEAVADTNDASDVTDDVAEQATEESNQPDADFPAEENAEQPFQS
tara:strand:- start:267 stop:806 length:540 start_codon:yes stop_codon:yes gene_type:complete